MLQYLRSLWGRPIIFTFAVLVMAVIPGARVAAEPDLPGDTPVPFSAGNVEEWTAGQGLVYWAHTCFADEFNPFAELRRKPAAGGTERTLESINDYSRCSTYQNLLSSTDGLYYFSNGQSRIERMPLAEPFAPQVVKVLTNAETPVTGRALVEASSFLYWVNATGKVLRTLKDGTGSVETVAETASSPLDVLVVGNTVYWTDSAGVWTINTSCGALPCSGSKSLFASFGANTTGYGLVYVFLGGVQSRYNLYWVQRSASGPNSSFQIRYRACNLISICTLTPPATFYSSSTNWFIGAPILVNGNLYWTERDISTVSNGTGDIKRKVRTSTTEGADTIATNQASIDSRLFAANDLLLFARRGVGIFTLALNATTIVREFTADALEVTQAIQNLASAAPLVAEKTTIVRAYGRLQVGPDAPNVEARLVGTKNGTPLPGSPLQPVNGVRGLVTGRGFDRTRLDEGWYFQLPASWTSVGAVSLRFVVDPRLIHTDPNRADNEIAQTVTFQNQPPVCVWTVPVRTHTPLPATTDPNFWSMVSHFDRRWPVPATWIYRDTSPVEELQVCWYGPVPYPCFGPYELEDGWAINNGPPDRDKVIMSLWTRAQLSFNPDACDDIAAPVHFMGMVHPEANNGGASGYASLHSTQSWVQLPDHDPNPLPSGWNSVRPGRVMAQELAHNYGRKHINCGDPDDIDSGYPYPGCQISDTGSDKYYGFDTKTLTPIRPDQASDFMTYGSAQWVSDYTWRALINSFAAVNVVAAAPTAPDAGSSVYVSGWVDTENNRGQIASVLVLPTDSVPPATRQAAATAAPDADRDSGPQAIFRLRLLDAIGSVLSSRTLTPLGMDIHVADGDSALFSDLFAQPGGQVATIQLLADTTVIDSLSPGHNPPSVAVQQPGGGDVIAGAMSVQWTASDPDPGDQLLYTVQYSHDNGAGWHTLVADYPGLPQGGGLLEIKDLGSLAGGGANQSLIRVLASDGYNTGIAISQPFTVQNRAPEPYILAPAPDQTFAAGQSVSLQGGALDPEEGGLAGEALDWIVDGLAIGSGPQALAAGLAPGSHAATLEVADSSSNAAATDVAFTVAPLSVPLTTTLTLDGSCDDSRYVGGALVSLEPYADGAQASVRLIRTDAYLWACFSGLNRGAPSPGAFVGLRVDVDNSRSTLARTTDFGFFVAEDGSVFTTAGDGDGGFSNTGPGGLLAQVSAGPVAWSAELRVDKAVLGDWDHLVGLAAGHYSVGSQGDDYLWPFTAVSNKPSTWAETALGAQPVIFAIDPFSATVQTAPFELAVLGEGFVDGDVVIWTGNALPTTFIDHEHLTAAVGAGQLAVAGPAAISVRAPAPASFESNEVPFQVDAMPPVVASLSPASVFAGSPATLLTVNGSHFTSDAQVLWNGAPLATQFINANQVKVQLTASQLAFGQVAGVAVRNQLPVQSISNAVSFEVNAVNIPVYLPLLQR